MGEVSVSVGLLQAIANYLAKQPWGEANPFMVELSKLVIPKEETKEAPKAE